MSMLGAVLLCQVVLGHGFGLNAVPSQRFDCARWESGYMLHEDRRQS